MAVVDCHTVAAHLNAAAAEHQDPELTFKAVESENWESEDDEVKILRNGKEMADISFQVSDGYVVLNRYLYEDGRMVAAEHVADWGVQPSDFVQMYPALNMALLQSAAA